MRHAFAAAVLLFAVPASAASAGDADAREWCQDAGNGARTSAVDVDPIREQPVEAWRLKPDEGAICAPVTWGGTVFVLSRDAQKRQVLTALDARTGAVAARCVRGAHLGDVAELVSWEGTVAVVEPTNVEGFAFAGTSLRSAWRRDGKELAFPCVHDGRIYVADSMKLKPDASELRRVERAFAMADGKDLGRSQTPFGGAVAVTKPLRGGADAQIVGVTDGFVKGYEDWWILLQSSGIRTGTQAGRPFVSFESAAPDLARRISGDYGDGLAPLAKAEHLAPWYGAIRLGPEPGTSAAAWLLLGGVAIKSRSDEPNHLALQLDAGVCLLLPVPVRPAVRNGHAYSLDAHGNLVDIATDGSSKQVLERAKLPDGASAPSIARDVAYFGNWAFDLDGRRVLWIHATADKLRGPAIPAGDGLLLQQTVSGELVCLAARQPK